MPPPGPVDNPPPGPVDSPPPGPVESPPPGPVESPPPGPVESPPPGPVEHAPPGPVEPTQSAKTIAEENVSPAIKVALIPIFIFFTPWSMAGKVALGVTLKHD